MKASQISLLVAFFLYLSYASNDVTTYRNWPVWGHDSQHSRFQSDPFAGSLCGAQSTMSFPTTSSQSVVDEGVLIYCKSGSASLTGYDLTQGRVDWTTKDFVPILVEKAVSADLVTPVFLGVEQDADRKVIVGTFTVNGNTTGFSTALFVTNTTGSLLWNVTARDSSPVKSLVIHSSGLALLSYESHLDALLFRHLNGTAPTYEPVWTYGYNGTSSVPVIISGDIVVYSGTTLVVLDSTTGNPKKSMTLTDAGSIVFVSNDLIALSSDTKGTIVTYPSMAKEELPSTKILAVGPGETFVAYQIDTKTAALRSLDNGTHPIVWQQPINVTANNVVASVDAAGLVYFLTTGNSDTLFAFHLENGTEVWRWDHSSTASLGVPLIAGFNASTFLFVDSVSGSQAYSPSCVNGTCEGFACKCVPHFYGPSCSVNCVANATCSERGNCTDDGTCKCFDYYYGSNCGLFCKADGNETSGKNCFNGTCHDDGTCHCKEDWFGPKCNCNPQQTCNQGHGTCSASGFCVCNNTGGLFSTYVYQGPHCEYGLNLSFVAILIGIISLVLLCFGIGVCCCCAKHKKPEKGQFSLLPSNEVQRH